MNDIVEADYVLVLQLFHQRDLADCGRGCAFFGIEVDLFQSYQFPSLSVSSFEDLDESDKWPGNCLFWDGWNGNRLLGL
jgi:hypothetical protein